MPRKKLPPVTDAMLKKRPALRALREEFDGMEDIKILIQAAEPELGERAVYTLIDQKFKNGLSDILVKRSGRIQVASPEKYATWLRKYRGVKATG